MAIRRGNVIAGKSGLGYAQAAFGRIELSGSSLGCRLGDYLMIEVEKSSVLGAVFECRFTPPPPSNPRFVAVWSLNKSPLQKGLISSKIFPLWNRRNKLTAFMSSLIDCVVATTLKKVCGFLFVSMI